MGVGGPGESVGRGWVVEMALSASEGRGRAAFGAGDGKSLLATLASLGISSEVMWASLSTMSPHCDHHSNMAFYPQGTPNSMSSALHGPPAALPSVPHKPPSSIILSPTCPPSGTVQCPL